LNYIDTHFSENKDKIKIKTDSESSIPVSEIDYKLLGVAKHICGCALDLSLACLMNYNDQSKVRGVCMATCCHHLSLVEYLNNLNLYTDYLKLNLREIVLLFKATSWIFGPIEVKEDATNLKSYKVFQQKGFNKNYIGLISKYVVDLARVFYLISKNYKVFYIKYCKNEITTENNLILAIKENSNK
jgi:tRNA:m4X modification enzyme